MFHFVLVGPGTEHGRYLFTDKNLQKCHPETSDKMFPHLIYILKHSENLIRNFVVHHLSVIRVPVKSGKVVLCDGLTHSLQQQHQLQNVG